MSGFAGAIATAVPKAYLNGVYFTRIMRFLTILAVLLSPLVMMGGTPAQAMSHHASIGEVAAAPMPMGHCDDMDMQSEGRSAPSMDCAVACAAMLPEPGSRGAGEPLEPIALDRPMLISFRHGLGPEAATPPPRFA